MTSIKMVLKKAAGLAGMCLLFGVISTQAATLTVTTTADAGVGSLRQAIQDATANAEANVVTFNIPTTDPGYNGSEYRFTINLESALPDLPLAPLTLDNDQAEFITVEGDNTFRIFTLVDSAVVTINKLTISNGFSGGLGGGFYLGNSSTLNLNRCTVSFNEANDGGGIYMNDSSTLNIDSSTINGNTAVNNGGGIVNGTSGTINATSNTFDGNTAGNNGGAIYNTATITVINNTITNNGALRGGGIYNDFTATLNNNLVALNVASDGSDLLGRGSLGSAFSGVYNLIGNADGSEGLTGATNQFGSTETPIDPMIGILQNNGGGTFTRALAVGSPAIDKGNSPGISIDQCARARVYDNMLISNEGNGADIGAYEVQATPTSIRVAVSGRILSSAFGRGVYGAFVYLTDSNGNIRMAFTNHFGHYRFDDVATAETYFINVTHKRYQFDPQAVSVIAEMTDLNFIAIQGTRGVLVSSSSR